MSAALLETYYSAFNAGDKAAMLATLAPDVLHEPSQGQARVGIAAFGDFWDHMARCYREAVVDPVFMVSADGAHGSAEFKLTGTYLETDGDLPAARGQDYALRVGAFFDFADGKIARVSNHYNLNDWLGQVE
ncbi:nuclear transport factor 2 family protein [Sphingobium phenoxybenzoativorans]|uniref:Nuclear transport factor 2 family protein n=1 Tax=Sphingobium phenoxybenzoativorans TaxID=1592790 RepID=A0A975K5Q7_9SPHN|nr:nuclear transport factor 2 family protein [Sphingobium phenoxybenzoativorans]QUT05288.1 nuclear transport factor 2 family protein [Sphingobium phenoxybenzoativorans]